jgi:hypothetical protein
VRRWSKCEREKDQRKIGDIVDLTLPSGGSLKKHRKKG